jgi:hypothetical protein
MKQKFKASVRHTMYIVFRSKIGADVITDRFLWFTIIETSSDIGLAQFVAADFKKGNKYLNLEFRSLAID